MSRTSFDRDRFQKLEDRQLFYPHTRQILRPELRQAFSSDYRRMVAMQLEINGERRDFPDGLTVASLVAHLGMKADRVAVELNRDIVPRNNWDATSLKDGDKLEIVQFVGGGARDGGRAEGSTVAEADNGLSVPLTEDGTWECPSCGMANLAAFCPACGERKASREDYSLRHFLS